jgi:DNA-binding transcriptional LysR family regulator
MFSYHIADQIRDGSLQILLAGDEHEPVPVHLLAPHGRMQVPKVRAFVDFAVPRLKVHFARLTREAETASIQSTGGRVSAE